MSKITNESAPVAVENARNFADQTKEVEILEADLAAADDKSREIAESFEKQIKEQARELRAKIKESEDSRVALMNMLEDMEDLRRRAEEEKEKTLAIIANFSDGLMFFDAEENLELVNSRMEVYFEIPKGAGSKIVGKKIADLGVVPALKPLVELLAKESKPVFRKELFMSEKAVFEVSLSDISGFHGKIGSLLIAHDITREKSVERMKTEFVSIAAHQLRTPISAIKWTLRMILDGDLGPINSEQRDFLEKTYKSNERMIVLINDLLNVTRIEEGRLIFDLALVDMGKIAQSLAVSYIDIAKQKNINIEIEDSRGAALLEARVDVEKIKLVISNLIENAIKYTPAGGKIIVAAGEIGGNVEVAVRDTGMGIPASQYERIFTKYFRGANAVKMETEGTGLGLFIAKNIVESHGGKIWFESVEGRGATFFFTIPKPSSPAGGEKTNVA